MRSETNITKLLLDWRGGDQHALDVLFPRVYDELRQIAHAYLLRERSDHTLNTTALVHEAYLKLIDIHQIQWQDRTHFFAVAARAMRRILISYARQHTAQKRGGDQRPISLDETLVMTTDRSSELLDLDDALRRLAVLNDRLEKVVELRFFGGLSIEETAMVLDVSPNTVKRDWQKAKAWLYRDLQTSARDLNPR